MSLLLNAKVNYEEGYEPDCLSRTQAGKKIGKHRDRIKEYENIAKRRLMEIGFLDSYCRDNNNQIIEGLPLTGYQFWVIKQISKLFDIWRDAKVVEKEVSKKSHLFTQEEHRRWKSKQSRKSKQHEN